MFNAFYNAIFWFSVDAEKYFKSNKKFPKPEIENFKRKIIEFNDRFDVMHFHEKNSRLRVLANAYIPNSKGGKILKIKLFSASEMFMNMYVVALGSTEIYNDLRIKDGYAKPPAFNKLILELEKEIIKEMDLGYKGIEAQEVLDYRKKHWKSDIGIQG